MSELNLQTSVGEWVAQHPATSRVFQKLKMDFCCGGGIPLEEACQKKGTDPQEVLSLLQEAIREPDTSGEPDWTEVPLAQLVDHIVSTHHEFLKSELPRLEKMARRVATVHGERRPVLNEIRDVYLSLKAELDPHLLKEEQVLFPAICQLETATSAVAFPFGTVANPIRMMEHEHDIAGDAIKKLRELTDQFEPPADACNTYRALFAGLQDLESDLFLHIHKENNILFPRAAELENKLTAV